MTEIGYRLAATVARHAPRSVADMVANGLVELYVATHPRRARHVAQNLARLWKERGGPGAPPPPRETYRLFARTLLDFLAGPQARPTPPPRARLDEKARRILASAKSSAAPTMLVSVHSGPWERALQWLATEVGGLDALAAPHRIPAIERFFTLRRSAYGVRTLPSCRPIREAQRRLRAGGWIAALVDRRTPTRRRLERRGPGELVRVDLRPVRLAGRTGAQVLPGVSWLEPDGAIGVAFEPAFAVAPAPGGLTLEQAAARLQRFFDAHVRAHPTQWFEWDAVSGAAP